MATMTKVQAQALAAYISRVREDWRPAGIVAALEKAAPTCDVWDVTNALCQLAADPSVKTPGLLPGPGPHWRKWDGSLPTRRGDNDVPCIDHPEHVHPCPMHERTPPPAGLIDKAKAAIAKNPAPHPRFVTPKADEDRAAHLDRLRRNMEASA